jgi:hypothetical protein
MKSNPLYRRRFRKRGRHRGHPLFVECLEDRTLLATFVVTNTADSGAGSLRQAILDANAGGGTDLITFAIPGVGPHTIRPTSQLPTISSPVMIDGYTQGSRTPFDPFDDAVPNTNPVGMGSNAVLKIQLDGSATAGLASGLVINAGGSTVRGLVINRFDEAGIELTTRSGGGDGNIIAGNFIGTDPTGTLDLGNGGDGVFIRGDSDNNVIGGTNPADRNVISGNADNGIEMNESGIGPPINNRVQGNLIGTNAAGTAVLGNSNSGVYISRGDDNIVGGTQTGASNVISGNIMYGVMIDGGEGLAQRNVVQGNFIGTDVTGNVDLGNGHSGVQVGVPPVIRVLDTIVGGPTAAARNVISGNSDGVATNYARATLVQGNYIGTNSAGTAALGNSRYGVLATGSSPDATIGGTMPGAGNLISGNGANGVHLISIFNGITVQGNWIGTDVTGMAPLGNAWHGIEVGSYDNTIGDSTDSIGAGNTIAFNGGAGVHVFPGTGNSIRGNSIFSNGGLGIDLDDIGVTPNDLGPPPDIDGGSNNRQNFPVLTSATIAGLVTIAGTLASTPNTLFKIDFYFNVAADPSGHGEGQFPFSWTYSFTDLSGDASFDSTFYTYDIPPGHFITATATDPYGNTSEFSQAFEALSGDFNLDGLYDCADINALVAEIAAGTHSPAFDLTDDGLVNLADRDLWLELAGAANLPSRHPYLLGDASLDGAVDGSDFIAWNAHKFTTGAGWCGGDFNADGSTDGSDFIIWNSNKFTSSAGWNEGDVFSYIQVSWGDNPDGLNIATVLADNFDAVYPLGYVEVGIPGPAGFSMRFTGAAAINFYLPSTGPAGPLTGDLVDPVSSSSGTFGGQVLALRLNIDFSDAGLTLGNAGIPFGDLRLCNLTDLTLYEGLTVRDFYTVAATALGGGNADYPYAALDLLTYELDASFVAGRPSPFAYDHLCGPESPNLRNDSADAVAWTPSVRSPFRAGMGGNGVRSREHDSQLVTDSGVVQLDQALEIRASAFSTHEIGVERKGASPRCPSNYRWLAPSRSVRNTPLLRFDGLMNSARQSRTVG